MSETTATQINHDKALLTGNIHAAIILLHEPLRSFVFETANRYNCQFNGLQNMDFSNLLKCIRNKWQTVFAYCCPADLLTVAKSVICIRNKVSHQQFELNDYRSFMKDLSKLATLINQNEIQQKIDTFLKMGIVEADICMSHVEKKWWQFKQEGNDFYAQNHWTEAMNCYTDAIRVDSTQSVLFSNRALCELQLKKYQLAREDAEKAISIDHSKVKYYRTLSEALEKLNLYEESLEICKNGLRVDQRDDALSIRKRDCEAAIANADNDANNPRFWLKDGATYKDLLRDTLKRGPKLLSDILTLKPKPEYIQHLSVPEHCNIYKLNTNLGIAHKFLIDHKGDLTYEKKAFQIFDAAAKEHFAEGIFNAALYYLHGKGGVDMDITKGKDLLLKAAKQKPYFKFQFCTVNLGVSAAENTLGNMYRDGRGEDKDYQKAFRWYVKSALHGCSEGQNNLGHFLRYGFGCEKDLLAARKWFERAAVQNIAEAQSNLADLLYCGEGGEQDVNRARELYQAAANHGLHVANLKLSALTFFHGPFSTNVTRNPPNEANDPCFHTNYFDCEDESMYFQNEGKNYCTYCISNLAKERCSACKGVWYCSNDCQKKDWETHKLTCNKK